MTLLTTRLVFLLTYLFSITCALDTINYGSFTKSATYSIASSLGFFSAYNLNVNYLQVPNSTVAYASLLSGDYDVTMGAIDNVVNRRFTQGLNLTALGQLDGGPDLVFASRPDIKTFEDLRGKDIIVDSPVSGFAYVLRKVLGLNGLQLGVDYDFQTVGGTNIRYADLIAGHLPNGSAVYATILNAPVTEEGLSLSPNSSRINILARISDYVQPYASTVFAVTGATLATSGSNNNNSTTTKRDALGRLLAAHYSANRFLANPANKQCVIGVLAQSNNETRAVAALNYAAFTDVLTGEPGYGKSNFTVNRQGLLNVIDVRQQYGGLAAVASNFSYAQAIVPGPGKLIDYSVRDAGLAKLVDVDTRSACQVYLPKCS